MGDKSTELNAGKESPEITARDVIEGIGHDVVAQETGRSDRTVRLWKATGKIPSTHYQTIKRLSGGSVSTGVFAFNGEGLGE